MTKVQHCIRGLSDMKGPLSAAANVTGRRDPWSPVIADTIAILDRIATLPNVLDDICEGDEGTRQWLKEHIERHFNA